MKRQNQRLNLSLDLIWTSAQRKYKTILSFLKMRYPVRISPQKNQRKTGFLLTVVLPAALWYGAIHSRSLIIPTRCAANPELCQVKELPEIDRFSIGLEDGNADGYSYLTQNLSGVMALGIPVTWNTIALLAQTTQPVSFWLNLTGDLIWMGQAVAWNGLFTELSHLISQRPRPFVYQDPAVRGAEASHYTSFYSGHTSFVAVTQVSLLLFLLIRGAPVWLLLLSTGIAESMVFSTAYFRIFAGRHFLTDVLFGAFAGTLVALTVFFFSIRTSSSNSE